MVELNVMTFGCSSLADLRSNCHTLGIFWHGRVSRPKMFKVWCSLLKNYLIGIWQFGGWCMLRRWQEIQNNTWHMCVLHLLLHCPHMFIYIYIYIRISMYVCLSVYKYAFMYAKIHNIPYHYIILFLPLSLSLFLSWVLLSMRRAFYCMDKSKTQSFCEPRLQTVKSNLVAVGQLIAHTHTWTRQCKLGKPRNDIATWSGYENRIQIFAPKTDKSNHDICHGSVRKLRRIQCLDRIVLPWVVTLFSFVSHKSGTKIRPWHLAKPYTPIVFKGAWRGKNLYPEEVNLFGDQQLIARSRKSTKPTERHGWKEVEGGRPSRSLLAGADRCVVAYLRVIVEEKLDISFTK